MGDEPPKPHITISIKYKEDGTSYWMMFGVTFIFMCGFPLSSYSLKDMIYLGLSTDMEGLSEW